ncbi:hypothetical protein Ddc_17220 [Ditylenchus destructor]|nr:hypothetical protein Ddc_17220 [Ditylenchus destructor]
MPQNSDSIAIKRNIWNWLALDIQLDVFQCLRAYDLYRNGRFVSRQWYNVIEQHKGMLPKFRKLMDCSEQNRLIVSNEERRQRRYDMWRAEERAKRIRRNLMWTYLLLSFLSFIAVLLAQPISAEQIAAKMLLLMEPIFWIIFMSLHVADIVLTAWHFFPNIAVVRALRDILCC